MKTKAISSIFVLFAIAAGMASMAPAAYAEHSEITITPVAESGSPGCEITEAGCFNPKDSTVNVGSIVTFSNTDTVAHTFTSGIPSNDIIGTEFNTGILNPGDSSKWIPENEGSFQYFDMIHPWMEGLIIVIPAEDGAEIHSAEEIHSEAVEETVEEAAVEETVEEAAVEETVEEAAVEETVEEAAVEETVEEAAVEETVEEAAVEETVEEAAVEETVEEAAVEETVEVSVATQESEEEGGGCLIATAAYGSEMAPQVQLLREIRDNQLMNTEAGSAFMGAFNEAYYSFSPYIADMERENPLFKEAVKLGLTPMLSSLAIMESANSESEVSRTWTFSDSIEPRNVHRTSSIWNCQSHSIKKKLIFILKCN